MGKSLAMGLLVLFGCSSAFASEEMAVWKGKKAADALTRDLRGRMLAAIAESGPMGAISIYAYQAQAITINLERKEGVTAKRTSLRIRNPENAPDEYEKAMIERLDAISRKGILPDERIELQEAGGVQFYRYTKPIAVDMSCLLCHGAREQIPEDIRTYLNERYPRDQATGYRDGDFRGIVSVIIPEEQKR
jgi:hypothetical protein